jgi:hypothetical protein
MIGDRVTIRGLQGTATLGDDSEVTSEKGEVRSEK